MSKKQMTQNEIYKIRYRLYREAGYSPVEARRLRGRSLDIGGIKTVKTDGRVPIHSKEFIRVKRIVEGERVTDTYRDQAMARTNDTVYSHWGMMTQDERYRDDTAKTVKWLQRRHGLSNDQAYYMLYYMMGYSESGIKGQRISYEDAVKELLSNKEFEMYEQNKQARMNKRKGRG